MTSGRQHLKAVSGLSSLPARWASIAADERGHELARALYHHHDHWQARDWLMSVLDELERLGQRGFDGPAARRAWRALPGVVTVHRGTAACETEPGVHWTLSWRTAVVFAVNAPHFSMSAYDLMIPMHEHHAVLPVGGRPADWILQVPERVRPVVLTACVPREALRVLAFGNGESEVLVHPRHLGSITREYATQPAPASLLEQLRRDPLGFRPICYDGAPPGSPYVPVARVRA